MRCQITLPTLCRLARLNPAQTLALTTLQYILDLFQVDADPAVVQTIDAITGLPLDATLRKASLQLVSRLPTASETALVAGGGESGLRTVLDNMMTEDAFFERLTEIFNDQILTDRYLSANGSRRGALNLMLPFPDRFWFGDPREAERTPEWRRNMILSNDSVAREPLQLINHVVKNNLPMTEILTADYFMVNPYSARSYGVFDELPFQNGFDEHEWLPQLEQSGIPKHRHRRSAACRHSDQPDVSQPLPHFGH